MRFPASPLAIWAIEDDAVQVVWGDLPPGEVQAEVGNQTAALDHVGGAGALVVNNLPPSSKLQMVVRSAAGTTVLKFTTLTPPPGERLARIATVSDLHLGAERWGFLKTMNESKMELPAGIDPAIAATPASMRCATAAIDEAVAWGASQLVIKGDAAHHRTPEAFQLVDQLVDKFADLPILMIPGNHDVDDKSDMDVPSTFGQRQLPLIRTQDHLDLPGLRLVATDSTIDNTGPGTINENRSELLDLVAGSPDPVLLAIHHHFQPRSYPTYWPLGIPAPESTDFLTDLGRANKNTLVTSGHTHRNRVRHHGPVLLTQVASTRDWPGVWAGYTIYEGGISQVVRRIAQPGAIHWHEYSKDAVGGIWRYWSSGPMKQRCLSHSWT